MRAERHFPPKLCSNKGEGSATFSVTRKTFRAQNSAWWKLENGFYKRKPEKIMFRLVIGVLHVLSDLLQAASELKITSALGPLFRLFCSLQVIGDKKGGKTSKFLSTQKHQELTKDVLDEIDLPIRLIHMVRNPYDNIATMTFRSLQILTDKAKASEKKVCDYCYSITTPGRKV